MIAEWATILGMAFGFAVLFTLGVALIVWAICVVIVGAARLAMLGLARIRGGGDGPPIA